jgi:hypothetical protein
MSIPPPPLLPTVITGGWGSTLLSGGNPIYLGVFDVTVDKSGSDGAMGFGGPQIGNVIVGTPASGTKNIYYAIEARAAYTPSSAETFKATFEVA